VPSARAAFQFNSRQYFGEAWAPDSLANILAYLRIGRASPGGIQTGPEPCRIGCSRVADAPLIKRVYARCGAPLPQQLDSIHESGATDGGRRLRQAGAAERAATQFTTQVDSRGRRRRRAGKRQSGESRVRL
jgi:hypothetical protein